MSSVQVFTTPVSPSQSHILTAWSLPELRARAKAQGETIVEASYNRLTGWTARTAPLLPAVSRMYEVSTHDTFTGYRWSGTVTLTCEGEVWTGAVSGRPCAFGEALRRLEDATYLRLTDERLSLPLSNPVVGTAQVAARVGGAR